MSATTPGCGSTSDAEKRRRENAGEVHDTETLAEVRLTADERKALRRELDTRDGSPRHRQMIAHIETVLAARIVQARAGEGALRERVEALEAAVDRVRRRHPRGDEEGGMLAPGLWCPTCGHERSDNGYGGCPDRRALIIPGYPLTDTAGGPT